MMNDYERNLLNYLEQHNAPKDKLFVFAVCERCGKELQVPILIYDKPNHKIDLAITPCETCMKGNNEGNS